MNSVVFYILSFLVIFGFLNRSANSGEFLSTIAVRLQAKAFPSHSDFEYAKFSILRILFGLLLLSRSLDIHTLLTGSEVLSTIGLISAFYLLATVLLTIGLFTQYALLFLVFFMWQSGDAILGTATLGNDIGAMLAVVLFLTGSGKYLSIDSKMIGKGSKLESLLLYTYGNASTNTIALVKLAALTSYWAVCVYSLSMHLNEPAWMSGVAGPLLLTNSFMSSWHDLFSTLFNSSELAVHLARYSMWAMMLWYPMVLPFVLLGGVWRSYVIIWGLLFFTLSSVVLNLGSLAEIEFLFWAAIFWSKTGLNNKDKISIFYDDKCNLCDKTIRYICALDIFSRVKLKPVSENYDLLKDLGIDPGDALTDLYGVCNSDKTMKSGYSFYILLSQKIVLLWPFYPLLVSAKIFGIGSFIYRIIARKRIELFGVCTLSSIKLRLPKNAICNNEAVFQKAVVVHILFLSIISIAFMPAPYIGIQGSYNMASQAAHYYGITPINVFNKTDLRLSENWFTLESIDYDEVTPVFNRKGERLAFHKSDRVYFGGTLVFRRVLIDHDACAIKYFLTFMHNLSEIYLNYKDSADGKYTFRYRQYHQPGPDDNSLEAGIFKQREVELRCDATLEIDYKL